MKFTAWLGLDRIPNLNDAYVEPESLSDSWLGVIQVSTRADEWARLQCAIYEHLWAHEQRFSVKAGCKWTRYKQVESDHSPGDGKISMGMECKECPFAQSFLSNSDRSL